MKKTGLAKFGQKLGDIAAGHLKDFDYKSQQNLNWKLGNKEAWILNNVKIIDVKKGRVCDATAVWIDGDTILDLLTPDRVETVKHQTDVKGIIDGKGYYLIPGLSDLHCHLSLVSEYNMKLSYLHYFDGQRKLNCEYALKNGCTFVRDSGGAYDMVSQLIEDIESGHIMGPTIFPSYEVMTPKGGMWDVGKIMNKLAEMIFGGKLVNVIESDEDVNKHFEDAAKYNTKNIKVYTEEKPLYGGKKEQAYNMFSDEELKAIVTKAKSTGKPVETHAMFLKGARRSLRSGVTSIAHLTVDGAYTYEDAKAMAKNNVAIIPTTTIGCYLAYNFANEGYQKSSEFQFYRKMLDEKIKPMINEATIEQIRPSFEAFYNFIWDEKHKRKMPGIGEIYPKRVQGFSKYAAESFSNFIKAGVKIGMGTDGGTGMTFSGNLAVEFEAYKRYGMDLPEILRSATITNMEILGLDKKYGSIEPGKMADMVLLTENPLEDIGAISKIAKVFKGGKCFVDNTH
ncbi:amidohydrolase family protein [Fusibacter sp. JL216-2]|uniref:amidohydrolase family protein n=1 Tax=Fusibacter sp. JL216-2 TaxID=3071453 RepID=UPI003D348314